MRWCLSAFLPAFVRASVSWRCPDPIARLKAFTPLPETATVPAVESFTVTSTLAPLTRVLTTVSFGCGVHPATAICVSWVTRAPFWATIVVGASIGSSQRLP